MRTQTRLMTSMDWATMGCCIALTGKSGSGKCCSHRLMKQ